MARLSSHGKDPVQEYPQHVSWYCKQQGDCTEVFRKLNYTQVDAKAPRGVVGAFTRESRMRLLRTVSRIAWDDVTDSTFITLTYPDSQIATSHAKRSSHRAQFIRDLEKDLGCHTPLLWRIEFKPRQSGECRGMFAPHFHLLAFNVPYVHHADIRKWWRRILDVEGPLATDVKSVSGPRGAGRYLSKYVSKYASLDYAAYRNNPYLRGRHWGLTRKPLVPFAPITVNREMTASEADHAQSYASGALGFYDPVLGGGFTLFGKDHSEKIRNGVLQGD